ncbi:uncharacterized protein LOC125231077 [Leguminivora glycinivorella]|uniref:uncharacterized protein LOC125231077 n=1 Tax=Leguminivora glycinivorella TaxID=1035111 RepID=UPI00200DEAFD|nr:uncharacterized protein LOC125231077 [Leguminivora glycinivorella]
MARLALFSVLAVTLLCGVIADSSDADEDRYASEDDLAERAASASAHASAQAQGNMYPRYPPRPVVNPLPQKSVRCVTCSGCPSGKNVTVSKLCPYSQDPLKNGKCVVFSEKYYHMKDPFVVRGCMAERGSCAEIKAAIDPQKDLVTLLSCRECEGDLCNGAGQFTPNLVTALMAMFVTPLLMKYTMS